MSSARFVLQMKTHGFDRDTLSATFSVDKPEISRLLTVAQALGEDLIFAISPAPKIGRPRWLQLVKGLEPAGAREALNEVLGSAEFQNGDSDQRFTMALQAIGSMQLPVKRRLASPDRVAWVEKKGRQVRLVSDNPAFASFI
ncbi:MAG: hypothetical protein MO852_10550 [Candidatus Devosia euplotis]|nr:hypothetical protein [Candidatus Devosia euplotis]